MTSIHCLSPGDKAPEEIQVLIEIPMQSNPVKYEVDKSNGMLCVDRFLNTAMYYPCNYGYVPGSLSEDGDPIDVLVVAPFPILSGALIRCRPIGMLKMTDEHGPDAKVIAVPISKLSQLYEDVHQPEDLPQMLLHTVQHFFEHYKDLEKGKWVKVEGWEKAEAAKQEIVSSIKRYQDKK